MNVQSRRKGHRNGQAVVRIVLGLGIVAAGLLAYLLSPVNALEAVVLPAIVLGTVAFGIAVYSRARYREEWSAAWDAYARREVSAETTNLAESDRTFSMASTN